MKVSMTLTLDGLVRALRASAHRLADAVEQDAMDYTTLDFRDARSVSPRARPARLEEDGDDLAAR